MTQQTTKDDAFYWAWLQHADHLFGVRGGMFLLGETILLTVCVSMVSWAESEKPIAFLAAVLLFIVGFALSAAWCVYSHSYQGWTRKYIDDKAFTNELRWREYRETKEDQRWLYQNSGKLLAYAPPYAVTSFWVLGAFLWVSIHWPTRWRFDMEIAIGIVGLLTTIFTAAIAWLTWRVSQRMKQIEEHHAASRDRASAVWRMVDEAMRCGYTHKDRGATADEAWTWLCRLGTFSNLALGYHAYRVVFMRYPSLESLKHAAHVGNAIQEVLYDVYNLIFEKVVDGRIRNDFDVAVWREWSPDKPIPPGIAEISPPGVENAT